MSRRMQRPVVVLPQPLSPTSPSTSPGWIENDTPSTARTWPTVRDSRPRLIGKCLVRSVTSSSGSATGGPRARRGAAAHRVERAGADLAGPPATGQVGGLDALDRRILGPAAVDRAGAARVEPARGREARRVGHVAGDDAQLV